ncbi:MAG: hypothetical protein ACE5D7_09845 [Fidelibacterota bacterium]
MPNQTTNQLKIEGSLDSLYKLQNFVKGEEQCFSCNSILPMPKELEGTIKGSNPDKINDKERRRELREKYGYDNWYDWQVANWGVKWGVYSLDDEPLTWDNGENSLSVEFYSPWSPPFPVIALLAKMYPELRFTLDYFDEGWGYAGQTVWTNGMDITNGIDHLNKNDMNRKAVAMGIVEFDDSEV